MQGRRVPDGEPGVVPYEPGDYGRYHGVWYFRPPANARGEAYLGSLAAHTVVEHENGTITVSPSILLRGLDHEESWHGWLERGVWRAC